MTEKCFEMEELNVISLSVLAYSGIQVITVDGVDLTDDLKKIWRTWND